MGLSSMENEGVSQMERVRGNFDLKKKWFSHVPISFSICPYFITSVLHYVMEDKLSKTD